MPRHEEKRPLPYTAEQIFDVVADVDKYPEFLPWCVASRVFDRQSQEFHADLLIGFRAFRERFTSHVTLVKPTEVHVEYIKGPMKYLHNDWIFIDQGDGTTLVDFIVDFEFKSHLLETLIGDLFTGAVHHMVAAFEDRVRAVYGEPGQGA